MPRRSGCATPRRGTLLRANARTLSAGLRPRVFSRSGLPVLPTRCCPGSDNPCRGPRLSGAAASADRQHQVTLSLRKVSRGYGIFFSTFSRPSRASPQQSHGSTKPAATFRASERITSPTVCSPAQVSILTGLERPVQRTPGSPGKRASRAQIHLPELARRLLRPEEIFAV